MKVVIAVLALSFALAAAEPPVLTPATAEERAAVAQKTISMQEEEITFQQKEIESLKAAIAAYEKILMQPAYKAQSDVAAKLEEIRKAHNAKAGCELNPDGSWKCPQQ